MSRRTSPVYNILLGLTALAVLLQGLWAGLFLRGSTDAAAWVNVHSVGSVVAIVLAVAATVVAFVHLRSRRDLCIGTGVLAVLLVVETVLGGLIDATRSLTVVHVPLAMVLMALATWLPLRARSGSAASAPL